MSYAPAMRALIFGVEPEPQPKPDTDNRPVEQPVAIVTARKPRGRKAAWVEDGGETPESVKAFLARMVRPLPDHCLPAPP